MGGTRYTRCFLCSIQRGPEAFFGPPQRTASSVQPAIEQVTGTILGMVGVLFFGYRSPITPQFLSEH